MSTVRLLHQTHKHRGARPAPELRVRQPPPTVSSQAPADPKEDLHLIIFLKNLVGKVGENMQLRKFLFVKQNCTERETGCLQTGFYCKKIIKSFQSG